MTTQPSWETQDFVLRKAAGQSIRQTAHKEACVPHAPIKNENDMRDTSKMCVCVRVSPKVPLRSRLALQARGSDRRGPPHNCESSA